MAVQMSVTRNERQAYWGQLFEAFQRSGETVSAFCRQQGISPASFYHWRKKLAATSSHADDQPLPGFIDLGALGTAGSAGRLEIRLDLGGGLMLQVVRG